MWNRTVILFLLLVCLTSTGCRERWRHTSRGFGGGTSYARSRGYSACVDSPGYYMTPPEQMLRAESRELRNWYRELDVAGNRRASGRGRVRGRLPRGVHGPMRAHGSYYDDYEDEYYADGFCSECGSYQDCGGYEMDCGGMPIELGCNGPFPMMEDGWTSYPGNSTSGYPMDMSSQPCPVCGHHGPAYEISPDQVVPHQAQDQQNDQYMPQLQQVPPAPTYAEPPSEAQPSAVRPSTPAPPPVVPAPSADELAPTVPEPMPSPVEQTYFAPPLR